MTIFNLTPYKHLLPAYGELRVQENRTRNIIIMDGKITKNEVGSKKGLSARVLSGGIMGFAASETISESEVKKVLEKAKRNADYLKPFEKNTQGALQFNPFQHSMDLSTKKSLRSTSEILRFLMEVDAYIAKTYPDLKSRMVRLIELDMEKDLINTPGSVLYSLWTRSHIYIRMIKEKDGIPYSYYEILGGAGDFEDHFEKPEDLYPTVDLAYKRLVDKTEAVEAKAGMADVIIGSELTGILAHEAVGHTAEADTVLSGSFIGHLVGQQVANEKVSLVDFANTYNGELLAMPVFIDDEGTKAEDAVIIENGILKGFMHNLQSAEKLGVKPTGNARAFDFFDEPLIRMRNTAILPGKDKIEDMIASIENGYYIMSSSNGQADSTGEFMFGVQLGYEIKNGKLGRALKETTVSGMAFDVLKSTTMLADDLQFFNNGYCGKKQMMPTADGGPTLKCRMNIGGN
ncbi:TldD/PmbA family protein [Alkaliphilus hydrothermalis]|uniref:TldD protein n=1 Tax=Alkaliphilus hydrothermalis TaxID=1482730 RepID=A0ABS2NSG8_9FIRM|nr:TldD/PmbA family protein [Alkaliphilus hydrothermalis]MBM7615880.1 TldD protein [Alkaliphilus hydrothermalis]